MPTRLTFRSGGVSLVGDLYLPADAERQNPLPAVVTAPGLCGVKEMLIPAYARALARAGVACLAFDYACFGASGGEPRQQVEPHAQIAAFQDALGALATDPRFDRERLGVWGTSLAGAHAITVAATDPRVRCAVALIPFIKSRGRPPGWLARAVLRDVARRLVRLPGGSVAVTGRPGDRALMTTDGAYEWISEMVQGAPNYVNRLTTASLLRIQRYNTAPAAATVAVPLRVILAEHDTITPARQVLAALNLAARADARPNIDVARFPDTHFELFGAHRDQTVALTVDWLTSHLSAGSRRD